MRADSTSELCIPVQTKSIKQKHVLCDGMKRNKTTKQLRSCFLCRWPHMLACNVIILTDFKYKGRSWSAFSLVKSGYSFVVSAHRQPIRLIFGRCVYKIAMLPFEASLVVILFYCCE
jgi:hypothetical protein